MARVRRQAAVIPYRIRKARVEVALVTTSKGHGWIVPKGCIDEGERARDAAIREAEEEAGLRGVVARRRLGRYRHVNGHGPCLVDVYLMRVTTVMETWMEHKLRRRRWMRVRVAADHLHEDLGGLHPRARPLRQTGALSVAHDASREPAAHESVYVLRGDVSQTAITSSLRALLRTRHRAIARYRFTMLDTFDRRVRRVGARLTRTGTDTLSTVAWQPRDGRAPVTARLTEPVSFAWDLPHGPLHEALAPVIGVRRLLPQADAEGHGSELDILDDRHKTIARVRIESGQVRQPLARTAWRPLPTILTLMGLRGYDDAFEQLKPVIASRPGISSCPDGLESVIFQHAGVPDARDAPSLRLDLAPGVPAEAGAREIHRAIVAILAANEPGLRADIDTEFLHDFRVALRRTRSLLRQLKHVFPPDRVEHFSGEFSWLGRLTGPPRDLDVLVLALRTHAADLPTADMEALIALLGDAQAQERTTLIDALDSPRYQTLLADWRRFLARPSASASSAPDAALPLAEVVSRRAWRLSQRLAQCATTIDEHTDPAHLHAVRITAKKLRYLIDVTSSFYDADDLESVLTALKRLQRVLGDFNDAQVQEARLLDLARTVGDTRGPSSAVLALGRLAERSRQRGIRLYPEAADQLHQFGARATRSACRRAFKPQTIAERAR